MIHVGTQPFVDGHVPFPVIGSIVLTVPPICIELSVSKTCDLCPKIHPRLHQAGVSQCELHIAKQNATNQAFKKYIKTVGGGRDQMLLPSMLLIMMFHTFPVLGITKCDSVREATYLKVTFIKGEKIGGLGAHNKSVQLAV